MPEEEAYSGPGRRAGDTGRYGRLSRERVLDTALQVVDRDGLSALSMRRVAAELDVEAMALYRYANSKDGLLDGLVETLHDEISQLLATDAPDADPARHPSGPEWRHGIHRTAFATYQVSRTHPNAVPLLATRMLAVPLARRSPVVLRNHERVLALLADAGLSDRDAATAHQAITAWILGYVLTDLEAMVDAPDESNPAFRLGLQHISAREFPRLRAVTPKLAVRGGLPKLTAGLDALLDCFVTRPES
ncbi:AcrR family transcriptional regulator [Streptacidiphilus sp. MAP12-20]|uniref:TetR/AcrR family transcriptional regulator n=1 Tax=Streptacidiphilus sp. MAP12-20 TaxID=3156299 RepID=UPI0035125E3B